MRDARRAARVTTGMSHRTIRTLLLLAATCAAVLVFPAAGMARSHGDRNGDRIPDRWERAHHLSLKVNQAKRDQDHDGLRNKAEFMAGDNPRDADTDNDGIKDGQEKAGQVVSFTGGVLIVHLFNGDDVKGTVDANTEIECDDPRRRPPRRPRRARPTTATTEGTRRRQPGPGDDDQGDDDQGDDDERGQQAGCDVTKLIAGAVVSEAELKATPAGLVFEKIELVGYDGESAGRVRRLVVAEPLVDEAPGDGRGRRQQHLAAHDRRAREPAHVLELVVARRRARRPPSAP